MDGNDALHTATAAMIGLALLRGRLADAIRLLDNLPETKAEEQRAKIEAWKAKYGRDT